MNISSREPLPSPHKQLDLSFHSFRIFRWLNLMFVFKFLLSYTCGYRCSANIYSIKISIVGWVDFLSMSISNNNFFGNNIRHHE